MKTDDLVLLALTSEEILNNPIVKWQALEDGVVNYLKGPYGAGLEAFLEDRDWIFRDDYEYAFSFINLCREFSISPQRLRTHLLEHNYTNPQVLSKFLN
jgi:hypothetical protein